MARLPEGAGGSARTGSLAVSVALGLVLAAAWPPAARSATPVGVVPNPGFGSGRVAPWIPAAGADLSITTAQAHSGQFALLIKASGEGARLGDAANPLVISSDWWYDISAWAYVEVTETVKRVSLQLDFFGRDYSGQIDADNCGRVKLLPGRWVQVTCRTTAQWPGGPEQLLRLMVHTEPAGTREAANLLLDDVAITAVAPFDHRAPLRPYLALCGGWIALAVLGALVVRRAAQGGTKQ